MQMLSDAMAAKSQHQARRVRPESSTGLTRNAHTVGSSTVGADAGDAGQRDSLAGEQEGQRRPHKAQHQAKGKDGETAHPGRG